MNDKRRKISKCEEARLDMFDRLVKEMYSLYRDKNHDYGDSFHSLYKKFGKNYIDMRLTEKKDRLSNLINNKTVIKDESIIDTLMDIANYSIMSILELTGTCHCYNDDLINRVSHWYGDDIEEISEGHGRQYEDKEDNK